MLKLAILKTAFLPLKNKYICLNQIFLSFRPKYASFSSIKNGQSSEGNKRFGEYRFRNSPKSKTRIFVQTRTVFECKICFWGRRFAPFLFDCKCPNRRKHYAGNSRKTFGKRKSFHFFEPEFKIRRHGRSFHTDGTFLHPLSPFQRKNLCRNCSRKRDFTGAIKLKRSALPRTKKQSIFVFQQ